MLCVFAFNVMLLLLFACLLNLFAIFTVFFLTFSCTVWLVTVIVAAIFISALILAYIHAIVANNKKMDRTM